MQEKQPDPQLHSKLNIQRRRTDIIPFAEKPSLNRTGITDPNTKQPGLNAVQLFSLFTADIIRDDVVFTR